MHIPLVLKISFRQEDSIKFAPLSAQWGESWKWITNFSFKLVLDMHTYICNFICGTHFNFSRDTVNFSRRWNNHCVKAALHNVVKLIEKAKIVTANSGREWMNFCFFDWKNPSRTGGIHILSSQWSREIYGDKLVPARYMTNKFPMPKTKSPNKLSDVM